VKLFLGLLSVVYDSLIIFQHFVLYSDSKTGALEADADLLMGDQHARI